MSQTRIKAVLFDLGETLILYGKVSRTWAFCRGARLSYDWLKECRQPVGSYSTYLVENAVRLRWQTLRSHWAGRDFDALELFKRVGARKGFHLPSPQWEDLAWRWYEPLAKAAMIEPHTRQTLTAIRSQGLKMGILSNTFVPATCLDRHLGQLGLLEFFPVRLYSYQVPFRKPHLGIFKLAAERMGELPEHILYVGDRIDCDMKPALRLGMHAALRPAYTNHGRRVPAGARMIEHLADLPSLIEAIQAGSSGVGR
jgi:HAD superfamily hydrolase (TIGR01549 family)